MDLIIVESPAKTKTIAGFLGGNYIVKASMGHIRDLPGKKIGIDIDKGFKPSYVLTSEPRKRENIKKLKEDVKQANIVYLCTDLDREGEAIAWHLVEALKIPKNKIKRATFSEITKTAVTNALQNTREVDMNLVDAQQARRVLDRLVGYKLSPFLWRKLPYKGLSAGRVQSAALKLIVDREKEIQAFVPEEYWRIIAMLKKQQDDFTVFKSVLTHIEDAGKKEKVKVSDKVGADAILQDLAQATYKVQKVNRKERVKKPPVPFTTSTLQMEAARKFSFGADKTMSLAQKLYEGIDLNGKHQALITYMRTDSLNLSDDALKTIRKAVTDIYGASYLSDTPNVYKTKSKGAQEAHEAIRPVDQELKPEDLENKIDPDLLKLYTLIWRRTAACQMKPAIFDTTLVDIIAKDKYYFTAKGEIIKFKGFLSVYEEGEDDKEEDDSTTLPDIQDNEMLDCDELLPEQKFTQPPARYSEASLVKQLEKNGVGRPSTYASIINVIKKRKYVEIKKKRFVATEIGIAVIDLLDQTFPDITDIGFTAEIENELDEVAAGNLNWTNMLTAFYTPFEENLKKQNTLIKAEPTYPDPPVTCPTCAEQMVIKKGKYGEFLGCSKYPECKTVLNIDGSAKSKPAMELHPDKKCPDCGEPLAKRKSKFGEFYGCSAFPKCKYIEAPKQKTTGVACPKCDDGELVEKRTKKGATFWGCSNYPKCKHATWDEPKKII